MQGKEKGRSDESSCRGNILLPAKRSFPLFPLNDFIMKMYELRNVSNHNFEQSLKKMCKEGAYWGTITGVYVGVEYRMERIRGTRDWKNAMLGGALTGALISAASNSNREKIVTDAITGSAIATAAEFLNYLI
ncbi:hypothetical protein HHK36_019062 [Tetracentron sinense]|uniref:Uncharacterized protein n=1 Tax=Tetracentron sinense TaxID=13715 RepID=A0A834Z0K9_TETSI|nr:hypothetical protein HHK36_019062 [Tetracentron sinense]